MGQNSSSLVLSVNASRDREDTVQLLQSEELGLGDKEPDEDEGDNVECGVGTESSLSSESSEHSGELGVNMIS